MLYLAALIEQMILGIANHSMPGADLLSVAENKDTLCRNVLIYGHCRYEDQGCTFSHDQNKNSSNQADMYVIGNLHFQGMANCIVPCQNPPDTHSLMLTRVSQVSKSPECRVSFIYSRKPAICQQKTNIFYTSRQCADIHSEGARRYGNVLH